MQAQDSHVGQRNGRDPWALPKPHAGFRFHSDPGHGWLEVPRSLCERLGLMPFLSSCSYEAGPTLYLEEDCDAGRFAAAYQEAYGELPRAVTVLYRNHCHIRGLPPIRRVNFSCPRCGRVVDGTDAEGKPCDDCKAGRVQCHACGWRPERPS